jgi:DNA-binding transcriptional LysR family regulator
MNLRHLRTFVAIAETGSFQGAARRLFITQSAVSMQMKTLETQLEVKLFDRGRRPPILSPLGRTLLGQARDLVEQAEAFQRTAAGGHELLGTLSVGVVPSATTTILPAALAMLRTLHPRLQVRVEGGLSTPLEERVDGGELDAAVITEPARLPAAVHALPVFEEPLLVAVPIDTPSAPPAKLLESLPFVRFNRATGIGRIIDAALRERHIRVDETMELDSIEAMLMMVSQGLGAAVVPARSLTSAFRLSIRTVNFPGAPMVRRVVLAVHERQSETAIIRALHTALVASADARQSLPEN